MVPVSPALRSGFWMVGAVCVLICAAEARGQACCLPNEGCIDSCGIVCPADACCVEGACFDDACSTQACCLPGAGCDIVDVFSCCQSGGVPAGPGSTCPDACGGQQEEACCNGKTCSETTPDNCIGAGGEPQGAGSTCAGSPCAVLEACCLGPDDCKETFLDTCLALNGEPQGPGSTCADIECAACPKGPVSMVDPPAGVVDARQPHGVNALEPPQGVDTLRVTAPRGAMDSCWSICETAQDGRGPNEIIDVSGAGGAGTYVIRLARPITAGAVTTLSYDDTGVGAFIFHPANVDGDTQAGPLDVLAIIDCLNGINPDRDCPWMVYSTDLDHSGLFGPADILTEIDLLNGAGEHVPWLGTARPVNKSCP